MAVNLFDHPYAAIDDQTDSNQEENSESDTNFKDSPRKVLVQHNSGASLNILNEIANSKDLSCKTPKDRLNGFQIETFSSSCDEMDADTAINKEKKGVACDKTVELDKSGFDKADKSDTETSKVLDIFQGITDVFEANEPTLNQEKEVKTLNGVTENNAGKDVTEPDAKDKEENEGKEVPVENDNETGTEEMDTSVTDGNDNGEETDDAEETENQPDDSLENSTELTSEIKTGVGNGIVVSVMKKRRGRRKKRKSAWSKPNPYKVKRVNSGSPRRISIEVPEQKMNTDDDNQMEEKETENGNEDKIVGTESQIDGNEETETRALIKEETSQSEVIDERLRSRRSRTPGKKEGFVVGDELDEIDNIDAPPVPDKGKLMKKALLFHRGRKAAPSQIKPLTPEESEKYKEPFKHGWKRELVFRGAYCESSVRTQADTYYFPPTKGPKLRSMVQITEWLASHDTTLTTDNFTFMRRAIGVEGEVVRNAAQSRGKYAMEGAQVKKRKMKLIQDAHIHDDNDGQFDQPEVVIERDSDDFLAPIMLAVDKESSVTEEAKKIPGQNSKELSSIPNLDELKEEKVEKTYPSNEVVIISPSRRKKEQKATARKSTTQKVFRKRVSITGVENLCSLTCPGMQGIPPMLHCNVCMCLFHSECVNYFGQDDDFVCLRCKDMKPPSAGTTPILSVKQDNNIMKVTNPTLLSHLQRSTPPSVQNVVRVYPSGEVSTIAVPSPSNPADGINGTLLKAATPPNTGLPLYKMLPALTGSLTPELTSHGSTINYPVLLTQNTSAFKLATSSALSSLTSSAGSPLMRAVLTSSASSDSRKSPALANSNNSKLSTNFQEIKPLIKQEPIDDSYNDAMKDNKNLSKGTNTTKASTEALDNLKNVLTSRLGSPPSFQNQKGKSSVSKLNSSIHQPFAPVPTPVRLMNNFMGNINNDSQLTISQHSYQPRIAFGTSSAPRGQFMQNQEYRIVPIGPPVPLDKLRSGMPVLQGQTLMPFPSIGVRHPVSLSPQIPLRPDKPQVSAAVLSPQEDSAASAPLIVNAKNVVPMNGQLLTLPPPVVKKLTLNRPLALKINNRQITVPPSGFFQSSEGLKVFLPPNTFPTADENIADVPVSDDKSKEKGTAAVPKPSVVTSNAESQTCAITDPNPSKDQTNKNDDKKTVDRKTELVDDVTSAKTVDIKKNKFYGKCCFMQRLYGGYDCMFHIFKHLELRDLVRVSQVCKAWRRISGIPDLWTDVRFRDTKISEWGNALKYISRRQVQSICLKNLSHYEEPNRTWHQLVSSLHELSNELSALKKISFGLVPAAVLQAVAGKLTQLESFVAESISDFTDDSMWDVPTKLDVGNFRCTSRLKVLKLRGTGGLSLPSFSFGCGLADIGKLAMLQTLHLTSLRGQNGSDFNFISNLTNLRELALGDCENWTQETYSHLQKLTSLERLRLESGGEIPDTGLGLALSHLTQLERLELMKYTIAYTFVNHIGGLTKLHHLCVFPVNMNFTGEVNTNTLRAVENLKKLKTLEWIIPQSSTSSIILDDSSSDMDKSAEEKEQWIPFQTALALELTHNNKNSAVQYISVQQLKNKLVAALPDTNIKVTNAKPERKLS